MIFLLSILINCFSVEASNFQLYSINNLNEDTGRYVIEKQLLTPGKVCGRFITNNDCAYLIYDKTKKGAVSLEVKTSSHWRPIFRISPASDFVYVSLEENSKKIKSSLDNDKDEIILTFYGKSKVKFMFDSKGRASSQWIED